jgi:hypothetical protein
VNRWLHFGIVYQQTTKALNFTLLHSAITAQEMKKKFLPFLFFFLLQVGLIVGQENDTKYKGTIKVQKKGHLVKMQFDNVNYRLVGIDQYGNVLDSAAVEFEISLTVKGIFHSEKTVGPMLSPEMQQQLDRCDQTTKLFFDGIKAKERDGTIIDMPKFQYVFRYSEAEY